MTKILVCFGAIAACATPPGRYLLLELFRRLQSLRVISRSEARAVYDSNARTAKASNDAESGYGGPASDALARLGGLDDDGELFIVEYGCGRGRVAMGWAADCRVQGWDGMGLVGWYRALWDWMG